MNDPQTIIDSEPNQKENLSFGISKVRSIDRGEGRMKLIFNLNKDQGLAYKNFRDAYKPDEIAENDFIVTLIIKGMRFIENEFREHATQYAKEHREDLASSGIHFIENEDGSIKFVDSVVPEEEGNE
jgi:hypothetical protein